MKNTFKISVILPAFNEEANIKHMAEELRAVLEGFNYEIIFVDDGSQDNTLNILKELGEADPQVHYLSFSRNFGHQNALKAGLDHAIGDCLVFMDSDLQHPPKLILEMIELWQKGQKVVYTIRDDNQNVSFLKQKTAKLFYKVLNFLSDVRITPGRADFFLIDKKVARVLRNSEETPLFFRGLLPWMGFKQTSINYQPLQRLRGKSKYSFKKMFEFAIDGITSFSIKPLRISIFLGISLSLGAFIYLIFIIYVRIFTNHAVSGWASILACMLLLGGVQLIILGIIGEYLGKLFMNTKKRPPYIIEEQSQKRNH